MTSCAGHIGGMKKYIGNDTSIPRQNQVKLFREEVDGHLQLLILKNRFSGLHTRSQTSLIVNIQPGSLATCRLGSVGTRRANRGLGMNKHRSKKG